MERLFFGLIQCFAARPTESRSLQLSKREGVADGAVGAALGESIRTIVCANTDKGSFLCPNDPRPGPIPPKAPIIPNSHPEDAAAIQWPQGLVPSNCVVQPTTNCESGGGWFCGGDPNLSKCYFPIAAKACVYSKPGFQGKVECYRQTGYFDAPWNDDISSLTVKDGCILKADKVGGMQGELKDFVSPRQSLEKQWDNQISAFTITC